jgi:hypothetical protein
MYNIVCLQFVESSLLCCRESYRATMTTAELYGELLTAISTTALYALTSLGITLLYYNDIFTTHGPNNNLSPTYILVWFK